MARGQTSNYASDLDTSAGTGPIAPNPANAAGGTQLPVGGTSTTTTDLFKTMFPPTEHNIFTPGGITVKPPITSPMYTPGGPITSPMFPPLGTPQPGTPPGAPRPGRPGSGSGPFSPFFGRGGNR